MLRTLFTSLLIGGSVALLGGGVGGVNAGAREIGFAETMSPRALGSIRRDAAIVVELEEPASRYLRGAILSDYREGGWSGAIASPRIAPAIPSAFGGEAPKDLKRAIVHHPEAYFLPAGAVLHREERGADGERVLYYREGEHREGFDSRDLIIESALSERLRPHAERLAGEGDVRERAERLRRALAREKRYSLDFEAPSSADATPYFIEQAEGGHCELFASAYVLLLRSIGIPARVVTGYVGEEDASSGSWRARKGDAHAWAEVFVDGRYHAADPTP